MMGRPDRSEQVGQRRIVGSLARRPARCADSRKVREINLHRSRQVSVDWTHALSFHPLRKDAQGHYSIGREIVFSDEADDPP